MFLPIQPEKCDTDGYHKPKDDGQRNAGLKVSVEEKHPGEGKEERDHAVQDVSLYHSAKKSHARTSRWSTLREYYQIVMRTAETNNKFTTNPNVIATASKPSQRASLRPRKFNWVHSQHLNTPSVIQISLPRCLHVAARHADARVPESALQRDSTSSEWKIYNSESERSFSTGYRYRCFE